MRWRVQCKMQQLHQTVFICHWQPAVCNAILAGLPASMRLIPFQRAQNAAARLVLGLDRRSSITTALRDLHWLPVKHRITFKVATLMHRALHCRCPAYLADLFVFSSTDSHRQLRSTTTRAAAIQRTRTQFGRRAFSVCGADVWNSLPPTVWEPRRLQLVLPPCSQNSSVADAFDN